MLFESGNFAPLSVGAFIEKLNDTLKAQGARVVGEVTQVQFAASGHIYFCLKDKAGNALLNCALWKSRAGIYGGVLKDGTEAIITGSPNIYAANGRLSFIAEAVELVGEGVLKLQYEALKKKLTAEGLFAPERKKDLPLYPHVIGVITSTTGAVIHDFCNNLGKHGLTVQIMDARVEGAAAVPDLLAAIKTFKQKKIDALVIIRGGGSFESLAAFDNEALVRAIVDLPFPVIAGIGHHQDQPLLCYAADLAVSTPTAAAVALNKSWDEAQYLLQNNQHKILTGLQTSLTDSKMILVTASQAVANYFDQIIGRYNRSVAKIQLAIGNFGAYLALQHEKIKNFATIINQNDPHRQLRLGYSLVRKNGKLVRSAGEVKVGDALTITLADSEINTQVIS